MVEKRYIRLADNWGGYVAELRSEYDRESKQIPMYDFYNATGRLFCIPQTEAEIISEKEYFMLRLSGSEIFNDQ